MASLLDIAGNLFKSAQGAVNPILKAVQGGLQQAELARISYQRERDAGQTRGQQLVGNKVNQALSRPVPQQLQPVARAFTSIQQNPVMQFGSGLIQGSNLGLGRAPLQSPQSTMGKIAYGAGSFAGSINPKSITQKVVKPIIGATNPILSKLVSPVANKAVTGRAAAGLANVVQGAALNPVYGRKPLEGAGLDFLTGAAFGPNQFGKAVGKGFEQGKTAATSKIDSVDLAKVEGLNDELHSIKPNGKILNITKDKFNSIMNEMHALGKKYLPNDELIKIQDKYGTDDKSLIKVYKEVASRIFDTDRKSASGMPEMSMGIVGNKTAKVEQTFRSDKFNLNKIQTKTLDSLRKVLGFDSRSVRTFDDMKAMAEELGTDPGRLLKDIETGRITDKEVVALGNVISTSSQRIASLSKQLKANPTDTGLLTKLSMEESVLEQAISKRIKGGTELGRGVAAFRIIANKNLDPAYWLPKAQKQLGDSRPLSTEETNAITKLIADKDRVGLAKFVSLLGESTLREKAIGLWKAGLLTSFRTHEANILSNAVFGALETAKDAPAAAFDVVRSAVTGQPRAKSFGIKSITNQVKGVGEGLKQAKESFITGVDARDVQKLDTFKPLRFGNSKAGRLAQKYTDTIFGALGAEDKVFREMAIQRSLADQAGVMALNNKKLTVKELEEMIANPPENMIKTAIEDAKTATFNNDNAISDAFRAAKKAGGQTAATVLDFVAPFVRTPTNVLARVVDYSPIGIVRDTVKKLANGSSVTDRQLSESFGRSVTGLGLIWAGMQLAKAGKIQGASPASEAERSQMYLEGKQPNSILVNGQWRKIDRFSPLGNLLVLGAEYQKTGDIAETAGSGLKALTEQSFLQGASQAIGAVQDPRRGAGKYVERAVGGLVPNLVKDVAKGMDPYKRDTNGVVDNLKYGLPGLRETLPVMLDAMGKPVKQEGGMAGAFFDPTNPTSATQDPIVIEMGRVGYNLNAVGDTLNKEKLTPAQKSAYQRMAGEQIQRFLPAVIQSQAYQNSDIDTQKSLIEKAVNKAKDFAREQVKADLPNIKDNGGIKVQAAETTGSTGKIYSYVDAEGSLKIVDLSNPIAKPKTASDLELNKKLISSYKSKLTSRQTQIADLYNAGQITEEEAVKLWDEVEAIKNSVTVKAAKKVSIKKRVVVKIKAPTLKTVKMRIKSPPKPKISKTKGYKIITYKDTSPRVKIIQPKVRWS